MRIFFAPNVHVGGGLTLLKQLDQANFNGFDLIILDQRILESYKPVTDKEIIYAKSSIVGRLSIEWKLRKLESVREIFCFHSLPTLFSTIPKVSVFFQNVRIFSVDEFGKDKIFIRARLYIEQVVFKLRARAIDRVIVQTPSVKRLLLQRTGLNKNVVLVCPFSSFDLPQQRKQRVNDKSQFIYVADDSLHKNHFCLLQAWKMLGDFGFKPVLYLTIPKESGLLNLKLLPYIKENSLEIVNLGLIGKEELFSYYGESSALIFPSLAESFGLPLTEASSMGLPIIASELDYVRDVCTPVETFDPHSAVSIARAVMRFMGHSEPIQELFSTQQFLRIVTKENVGYE